MISIWLLCGCNGGNVWLIYGCYVIALGCSLLHLVDHLDHLVHLAHLDNLDRRINDLHTCLTSKKEEKNDQKKFENC